MLKRLLVLAVLGVIVVGYFRGWYAMTSSQTPNSAQIGVSVDKDKVRQDAANAKERVQELKDTRTHD